ncbi:MAG: hypothetical protein ACXU7D_00530 [Burkholderiaceae bacterium]
MTDAALQKFFLSKLVPLQAVVLPTVSVSIDPQCESYFEDVLEPAAIVSQDDMVTSLIAIWQRLGMSKLVVLEPDFRKLAKELRAPETANQEVSDFIYAMY